jgi:hypothetical protein
MKRKIKNTIDEFSEMQSNIFGYDCIFLKYLVFNKIKIFECNK